MSLKVPSLEPRKDKPNRSQGTPKILVCHYESEAKCFIHFTVDKKQAEHSQHLVAVIKYCLVKYTVLFSLLFGFVVWNFIVLIHFLSKFCPDVSVYTETLQCFSLLTVQFKGEKCHKN